MNDKIQSEWELNSLKIKSKFKNFDKNPLHKITIEKTNKYKKIKWSGITVASSKECLVLYEKSHDPVYYFPPDSIKSEFFFRTSYATHCPYKGDAAYWNLSMNNKKADNCVWAYPNPIDEVILIKNYFSFYLDQMGKDFGIKIL